MGHSNIREVDYASGRNLMIFLGTRTPNSQVRRFQPGVKVLDPYRPGRILESVEGYCAVACLGLADGREAGDITGAWLVWYDPADAVRFTEREWAELYATAPANRPRRPDGKPNRPITIFNLMIVPIAPGELPSIPPAPEGVSPEPQAETDAQFMARLDRMVAAASARQPAGESSSSPPPP